MKRKDRRNLFEWRGTLWYSRVVGGRRYRVDTKCADTEQGWKDARLFRDEYERQKGLDVPSPAGGSVPTFEQLSKRYFESRKFSTLKPTSQQDRRSHLSEGGPLLASLGKKRVDEITADTLVEWWEQQSKAREWSLETGFRYLATISEVMKQGRAFLRGRQLPTKEARERMGEERLTAHGRARKGDKRPVRDPEAIERVIAAAEAEGLEARTLVLLLLDAGVRRGEALALRWGSIAWGLDEDDRRRHLLVKASRSRDHDEDTLTKSGRERRVALSRRLRAALGDLFLSRDPRPRGDARVFELDEADVQAAWARITRAAELPGLRVKDLRDTFGSWLLTLGIPIQYVSRQLGHGSIAVTETHYAEYLGGGGSDHVYVEPPRLAEGEVPADLLAQLRDCSHVAHTGDPFALPEFLQRPESALESDTEAFPALVPGSDFKSDEECGDAVLAGSIPVRFRHFPSDHISLRDQSHGSEERTDRIAGRGTALLDARLNATSARLGFSV